MNYKFRIALTVLFAVVSFITMATGLCIGVSPRIFELFGYSPLEASFASFFMGFCILTSGFISFVYLCRFAVNLYEQMKYVEFAAKEEMKEEE